MSSTHLNIHWFVETMLENTNVIKIYRLLKSFFSCSTRRLHFLLSFSKWMERSKSTHKLVIKIPTNLVIKVPANMVIKVLTNLVIKILTNLVIKIPTNLLIKVPTNLVIKIPANLVIKVPTKNLVIWIYECGKMEKIPVTWSTKKFSRKVWLS